MEKVLEKRSGYIELVHITTADRIDNICKNGILASAYGDLEVDGNDGAGVYAVKNKKEMIQAVIVHHFSFENEDLVAIHFRYKGEYYECVDEIFTEEDYEEYGEPIHKGYIVIPKTDSNHFEKVVPDEIIKVESIEIEGKEKNMTHEELMAFKKNIANPRLIEIFEKTDIPERLCVIDDLKFSFLDGRSCGVDSIFQASGLVYKDGKVSEYSYKETDVSVTEFLEAHKDCILLLDGKLQVYDELEQMNIQTVMRSLNSCIKVFLELEKLNDLKFDGPSFVWDKMKLLHGNEMVKKDVKKGLNEQMSGAKERSRGTKEKGSSLEGREL